MSAYELIGRSFVMAVAVLFWMTLFDLAGGRELRAIEALSAFSSALGRIL